MIFAYLLLALTIFLLLLFLLLTIPSVVFTFQRNEQKNVWSLAFLIFSIGTKGFTVFGKKLKWKKKKKKKDSADSQDQESKDDSEGKEVSKSKKEKGKKEKERKSKKDKFGWNDFLDFYHERELFTIVLNAVLRFLKRLLGSFRFRFEDFMLYFGFPDPYYTGISQGFLYALDIPHTVYYFQWKFDMQGKFQIRQRLIIVLFLATRLILECKPFRLYKFYRKSK